MTNSSPNLNLAAISKSPEKCKRHLRDEMCFNSFKFELCFRYEDALKDLQDSNVLSMAGRNTVRINQIAK